MACRTADAAACCYRLLCAESTHLPDEAMFTDTPPPKRHKPSLQPLQEAILGAVFGRVASCDASRPALDADDALLCGLLHDGAASWKPVDIPVPLDHHSQWLKAACALHCTATACARAAVGDSHPLADRIAFLPFFLGVPVPLASAITQALPGMVDDAMRVVMDACNRAP